MAQSDRLPEEVGNNNTTEELVDEVALGIETGEMPFKIYNNQDVFDDEMRNIFGKAWVFIGHESEIPDNGDYRRRYIGEDPYIFVRDENGNAQVLFDCCRHRGARLSQATQGNTSAFRCPYHGWTYKTNGDLYGVPSKGEAYKGLDRDEFGLVSPACVDSYGGLVFASLNEEAPSLEEYLGDMKFYIDMHFNLTEGGMEVIGEPNRWMVNNNWKVASENASGDAYHTQIVHRTIDEMELGGADFSRSKSWEHVIDIDGHNALVVTTDNEDDKIYWGLPTDLVEANLNPNLTDEQLELARRSARYVCCVFPNLTFSHHVVNKNPEDSSDPVSFLDIRLWHPAGPDEMELWTWILAPKEAPDELKKRVQKSGVFWNGPAGVGEQDDVPIWEGITQNASGLMAQNEEFTLNYEMGTEQMSEIDKEEEYVGPGTVINSLTEEQHRVFLQNWTEFMQNNITPDLLK